MTAVTQVEARSTSDLGILDLVEETLATTAQLAEKQIELLRAEIRKTIAEERRRVIMVSVGIASALCGLSVMLTAAALGAGLAAGHPVLFVLGMGIVLAAAATVLLFVGIRGLAVPVLSSSKAIMEEEIEWAKGKLAETRSSTSPETSNDSVAVESC